MQKKISPFFINSNICLKESDLYNVNSFISSVAGNTGNAYITYSLIKTLFGGLVDINHIQNIYEYDFNNQDKDIDFINNEATHVFLILQDQIRISESYNLTLPYDNIINFVKRLNKPVIIAGLGANSRGEFDSEFYKKLNPKLINFLKIISEHTEIIGIRGAFTQEILTNLGIHNTQIIGCPSFYETGPDRIIEKKEYNPDLRVLLAADYWKTFYNTSFPIVLQDNFDLIEAVAFNKINYSVLTLKQLNTLKDKRLRIFSSINNWKNFVSNFDFAWGTRVHGCILALNSGVCSVVMNSDFRAKEMTEFLKIPYQPDLIDETNLQKVYEICDYTEMNKCYPELYKNYIKFLNKNNLQVFDRGIDIKPNYIEQPTFKLYQADDYKDGKLELEINLKRRKPFIKKIFESIFSVTNLKGNKIINFCGLKFKMKKKSKVDD